MPKRKISDLDLKVKLTNEYLNNGGCEKICDIGLLDDLLLVKKGTNGKTDPNTVSSRVNAFMLALLGSQLLPPFYSPKHITEYETTLQKSKSFDQENIDTIEQFDKIYREYKDKTNFLFRGQREAKWRLYSNLQRHWILEELVQKFDNYRNLLEKLVELGKSQYNERYIELLGEKHDDVDNDIAVLSFLQHHSCPTPLLDWTFKFKNALFFALDGVQRLERNREIDDYISVYYINEENFENGGMRKMIYESIEAMQEMVLENMIQKVSPTEARRIRMRKHFKGRKAIDMKRIKGSGLIKHMLKIEHMINFPATYFGDGKPSDITFSLNNSKNIQNQAGVFTWNADPAKPFEMVVSEQKNEISSEEYINPTETQHVLCECFDINKKLVDYIRQILEQDGITKDFIYPTTDFNTWEVYKTCVDENACR